VCPSKICKKCNTEKPIDDFYRHEEMADGHLSFCKECVKNRVVKHRKDNILDIRDYDRRRSRLPHRAEARTVRTARWIQAHPERRKAQHLANNALRSGRITKKTRCERCERKVKLEKHHPDYSQPLLLEWLCKPCHAIADAERRLSEAT
jgi:hypothetical protein